MPEGTQLIGLGLGFETGKLVSASALAPPGCLEGRREGNEPSIAGAHVGMMQCVLLQSLTVHQSDLGRLVGASAAVHHPSFLPALPLL